ncbi:T9SS type A sorting domain-containing protein [Flavobacterium aciduliphilum]|uniref:Putative secreted protein (Por secretion system target) n=1 Tax=Flavobacterium aciduliphilum TaxID=1101402 RepID=A0A328YXW6_9FLAO|nr:T9SS type A sorting domain-containing protein [Flavobacterium aciduliphilum]RAR75387.1 putative secreted protein (Por secretion system target) [Flavobacterium aciduliphilum]
MKKLLLSFSLIACLSSYAQRDNVFFEDCSSMTVGNIGTDLTGTNAGQNGWLTFVSSTASPAGQNSDFQVVNTGSPQGNAMQITGTTASVTGQARYLFKDISSDWTNRTSGNDIAQVEFKLFTGPATASVNTFRMYMFDASGATALCGFYYVPSTKVLKGWAHYDNAGTVGYYVFQLGSGADITLTENTWYNIAVSFDYNTGDITWKESNGLFYGGVTGADAGVDVGELDFLITQAAAANTAAAQVIVDDVYVNFDSTETLLGVKQNSIVANKTAVYPNPTKDIVNVSNTEALINSVEISDVNGRVVKTVKVSDLNNAQINIADLSQGVYMIKINSDKGTATKKVVKE